MDLKKLAPLVLAGICGGMAVHFLQPAQADAPGPVVCETWYQDFPNGMVGPARALTKARELTVRVQPWLQRQLAPANSRVVFTSSVPYGTAGMAATVCVQQGANYE